MSVELLAWLRSRVGAPGPSGPMPAPAGAPGGEIAALDELSLLVEVERSCGALALEEALRARGLALGVYPETLERDAVGALIERDATGAGGSGRGFRRLLEQELPEGRVLLRIRRRPAVQAGRALGLPTLEAAIAALRLLAQDGDLPELALVFDAAAAELWLQLADLPDGLTTLPRGSGALLILIAAGGPGVAVARVQAAVDRVAALRPEDLGQNLARAWAAARYAPPAVADELAAEGYRLTAETVRRRWSELAATIEEVRSVAAPLGFVGFELAGADPHGCALTVRTLAPVGG